MRTEKLFLTRSTRPHLEELLDRLDEIPGKFNRQISLLTYSGWARRQENERITIKEYEQLPGRIRAALMGGEACAWKTEQEWIASIFFGEIDSAPREGFLYLGVNEENVDRLLSLPCDEIYADLRDRTDAVYEAMPDLAWLCDRYGDRSNLRMYMNANDLRKKWLDRYFEEHAPIPDMQLATWI